VRRREFITLLGSAATTWPLAAHAQQRLPVVGVLNGQSPGSYADNLAAFRQGLNDTGFVEHRNVGIEYRWAEGQYDRLPAQAADLVRRQVAVIFASGGTVAALAAKAATTTIPIVFVTGGDPVHLGLVASLNRPGGNVTGATNYSTQLSSKQLELLHELVPRAVVIGVLVNPNAAANAEPQIRELQAAAKTLGLRLHVLNVGSEGDANTAFATLVAQRAEALFVTADAFLNSRRDSIVALAARHRLPTMYPQREFVINGGLISYTSSSPNAAHQQGGVYTGRILKGEKPRRPAGHAADQVRASDQPQDRQRTWSRHPAQAARLRRRGDRMNLRLTPPQPERAPPA
jgi:putative ABC transport system substrate-binding protein